MAVKAAGGAGAGPADGGKTPSREAGRAAGAGVTAGGVIAVEAAAPAASWRSARGAAGCAGAIGAGGAIGVGVGVGVGVVGGVGGVGGAWGDGSGDTAGDVRATAAPSPGAAESVTGQRPPAGATVNHPTQAVSAPLAPGLARHQPPRTSAWAANTTGSTQAASVQRSRGVCGGPGSKLLRTPQSCHRHTPPPTLST
jgi:hypothetical protein